MSDYFDRFIELDRTFRDLTVSDEGNGEGKIARLLGRETPIRWPEILAEPRVIILAEAGSGKTEEIRHACRRQQQEGKPAFFLRIEHIVDDFDTSFEEGRLDAFDAWASSGQPGWLFLDSVDEARLRDPRDFERAIRKLGKRIERALPYVHIVITGRTEAWRPKTDLHLCRTHLKWAAPIAAASDEADGAQATTTERKDITSSRIEPFRIVSLEELHGTQVDTFACANGVTDLKAFKAAIDRSEAWSFTTRPLDLSETVEFWLDHGRIGSRLELMKSSITKRLEERDQNRADARPISVQRLREGVCLVAAATTLCQESAVRVPDGHANTKGLPIKDVLTDWNDQDCTTLLGRPIFDPGIYGTVRFHHRSVREFLTAEWLHSLLVDDGSRAKIEALFFRKQYGIEVIVPTMRPVLPWLAVLDRQILNRVIDLAPEVLFEGGDPSMLPTDTRRHILREICEQLAQPVHGRSMLEYAAVQRFANPDLANDIRALLEQFADDDDITSFLLRMVAQGEIKTLSDTAKGFALKSRSKYVRIAAIRAVAAVGTEADLEHIRQCFLLEETPLSRDWLAELLVDMPPTADAISWLLVALEHAEPHRLYQPDRLSAPLEYCVNELPITLLGLFIEGLVNLLQREPVVERRHYEISQQYRWLAPTVAQVAARLIEGRNSGALAPATLIALQLLPVVTTYDQNNFQEIHKKLPGLVQSWPALNHSLFWQSVAQERMWLEEKKGERLVHFWDITLLGHYWGFNPEDFELVTDDIINKALPDDRLIALTLAFRLYVVGGRPRKWREQLKRLAAKEEPLSTMLASLLHPPASGLARYRKQEAEWKRRNARNKVAREKRENQDKALLVSRAEQIRDLGKSGIYTREHAYLHDRMHSLEKSNSNRWTEGNWRSLIEGFGDPVARAFRDAAVQFWRNYSPQTRSQGAASDSTPNSVIFGLTGLAIEAKEEANWLEKLKPTDAEKATRYALAELNGFPSWLPALFAKFPEQVAGLLLKEIQYELANETSEEGSSYILYKIAWHGEWMRNHIAVDLLPALKDRRVNSRKLRDLLSIIQDSIVKDEEIAKSVARKANGKYDSEFTPIWFATWVGVAPDEAIPALAARLAVLHNAAAQTDFALRFIVALSGGRRQSTHVRLAYRTVEHIKALYLLMAQFIREEEDIDRAGTGVYSPGLRDEAQDARSTLFNFIRETPGKAAYLALQEMERTHPAVRSRAWMGFYANAKATRDADFSPWAPNQVKEFNHARVATPTNHRELWYLGVERLEDLKHDLEDGDESIASILQATDKETEFRKYIGGWLRARAGGRYSIPSEEELADAKRPDLRLRGAAFDGPVPVELKIADNWTGPHLFERMEVQLCGDYLRDARSCRGIFLLVYLGSRSSWELPDRGKAESFEELLTALRQQWSLVSSQYPNVEDLAVVGIDLTLRGLDAKAVKIASAQKSAKTKESGASEVPPGRRNLKAAQNGADL